MIASYEPTEADIQTLLDGARHLILPPAPPLPPQVAPVISGLIIAIELLNHRVSQLKEHYDPSAQEQRPG